MNLQPLFASPILDQQYLDRDYSGYGNDVWIVRTAEEHVVVRVSARKGIGGAYWTGIERLFGVDGTRMDDLRAINDAVTAHTGFRAPRVLRTGMIDGRGYAVTELMPGEHGSELTTMQLEAFGRALAEAHGRTFDVCGSPTDRLTYPLAEFHVRAADVIEWLASRFRRDERDLAIASECAATLRALPPPSASSLILYDQSWGQYLWDATRPTAVVDTECLLRVRASRAGAD